MHDSACGVAVSTVLMFEKHVSTEVPAKNMNDMSVAMHNFWSFHCADCAGQDQYHSDDGIADVTMPLATTAGASSAVTAVTALNCAASYQMMPSRSRLRFRSPLACHACNLMGKSSLKCHRHPYNRNEPCCI